MLCVDVCWLISVTCRSRFQYKTRGSRLLVRECSWASKGNPMTTYSFFYFSSGERCQSLRCYFIFDWHLFEVSSSMNGRLKREKKQAKVAFLKNTFLIFLPVVNKWASEGLVSIFLLLLVTVIQQYQNTVSCCFHSLCYGKLTSCWWEFHV